MANAENFNDSDTDPIFADELTTGSTLMHGQYTIDGFLNAGGFGITYTARDSLDRPVVIKECFPGSFCRRSNAIVNARSRAHINDLNSIVRLFVQEARNLSKLNHPNIVGVHHVFEENNTAYMALDFVDGRDLLTWIEEAEEPLTPQQVETILRQMLDALSYIHDQGVLHRDISPDNILVDKDFNPVLIDFGAAREEASKQSRVLSAMRVVKDGYSPQEFYISGSEQGPSSDLYALGATFYHLISGELPANSQTRLSAVASGQEDPYVPLIDQAMDYREDFLRAIDQALEILPQDRVESTEVWLAMLDGQDNVVPLRQDKALVVHKDKPAAAPKRQSKQAVLTATAALIGGLGIYLGQGQLGGSTPVDPAVTETAAAEAAPADAIASADAVPTLGGQDAPALGADAGLDDIPVIAAVTAPAMDAPAIPLIDADNAPVLGADSGAAVADDSAAADAIPALADIMDDSATAPSDDAPVLTPDADSIVVDDANAPALDELLAGSTATAIPQADTADVATAPAPELTFNAPVAVTAPAATSDTSDLAVDQPFGVPSMRAGWLLDLPETYGFGETAGDTRIFAVNGLTVSSRPEFDHALRTTMEAPETDALAIEVKVGATSEDAAVETLELPVKYRTVFPNGFAFEISQIEEAWQTTVIATPRDNAFGFEVGDILIGALSENIRFDTRTSFAAMVESAVLNGETTITVAIKRDETMTAASLPLPPEEFASAQ